MEMTILILGGKLKIIVKENAFKLIHWLKIMKNKSIPVDTSAQSIYDHCRGYGCEKYYK